MKIAVRLDDHVSSRLRQVAGRLPLSRAAVIREAVRLGLDRIEEDPASLVRPTPMADNTRAAG